MAVNKLVFGGVDSSTYGILISGEGVFNAPQRSAETITIPGRDGAYILDHGNFENITVTYPAYTYEKSMATFVQKLDNFRNALASKQGYQRLTDTFHTDEYRMASFIGGLEVNPLKYATASEFDIVFECKPQRWLTSGETKTTLTSGNAITNPTLFPSRPQLQTYGYGDISIGGEVVNVQNVTIGEVKVGSGHTSQATSVVQTLNLSNLNTGDNFTVSGTVFNVNYHQNNSKITDGRGIATTNCTVTTSRNTVQLSVDYYIDSVTFAKGTSSSLTATGQIYDITVYDTTNGTTAHTTVDVTITISYNGSSNVTYSITLSTTVNNTKRIVTIERPDVFGTSTKSALGSPTYIDLDIGEAYFISGGNAVSVNNAVSIPAELPTLPSGATTITFSNTFTKVDIVPRWWKV